MSAGVGQSQLQSGKRSLTLQESLLISKQNVARISSPGKISYVPSRIFYIKCVTYAAVLATAMPMNGCSVFASVTPFLPIVKDNKASLRLTRPPEGQSAWASEFHAEPRETCRDRALYPQRNG